MSANNPMRDAMMIELAYCIQAEMPVSEIADRAIRTLAPMVEAKDQRIAALEAQLAEARRENVMQQLATEGQLAEQPVVNAIFETADGGVTGTTAATVKRVERQDDGSLTVVIDHWPAPFAEQPSEAIRNEVAKLYCSSGCSCCRDEEAWEAATNRLGELLSIPRYGDDSGYDFYSVRDRAMQEARDEA